VRAAFVLVVVLVLVLAACSGGDDDPPGLTGSMCEAAGAASRGRLQEARSIFEDRHGGLHDLAAETAENDRAAAATLLRAKERVESDLQAARPRDLAENLKSLASAVGAAEGVARSAECP
jgi:hypothetical protein